MEGLADPDDHLRQGDSSVRADRYDVQQESEDVAIDAGIANLRLIGKFSFIEHSLAVTVSVTTSTKDHRGVHMSRLVGAATNAIGRTQTIEEYVLGICREVDLTQPGASARVHFELPFMDQFVGVTIASSGSADSNQALSYTFLAGGVTSCPCSRRISGVGHMQRATLELRIESILPLSPSFPRIVSGMVECFSAAPEAFLKRYDEARAVLRAQENSRFVEDVVRECLRRFPGAVKIKAAAFESMHPHDAVATWTPSSAGRTR